MVAGIDYSMTCPAICAMIPSGPAFWYGHESKEIAVPRVSFYEIDRSGSNTQRAGRLAFAVKQWLQDRGVLIVNVEDYAFAATGRVFHIGENTGILKYVLEPSFVVKVVPPTVVKKFATGKGNADKIKMTMAFLDAYPAAKEWAKLFFPRSPDGMQEPCKWAKSPLADLADAYWIARYADEHR